MARRILSFAFRALCLLLALALLARMLHRQNGLFGERTEGAGFFLFGGLALLLYLGVQFLGAWRWNLLLGAQGLALPYLHALRLTLGGNFFSLLIPGGVSGDIVKVGAATAAHPGKAPELALADLLDRGVGLLGLFWAGLLSLCLLLGAPWARLREHCPALLAAAVATILLGVAASLAGAAGWHLWPALARSGLPVKIASRCPRFLRTWLHRLGAALAPYRTQPLVLLRALGLSILIHLLLGGEFYLLGKALGESALGIPAYLLATQLANATALLPLTPGGLGVRDTVAESLFLAFGATPLEGATLIPLFYTFILTLWGLAGGLLYALTPSPPPSTTPNTPPHP
ncbi:MAG: lysylphosphatidylglycerol synthase transmembrane domain-containing protein [Oligosphaeraceae bacterium]